MYTAKLQPEEEDKQHPLHQANHLLVQIRNISTWRVTKRSQAKRNRTLQRRKREILLHYYTRRKPCVFQNAIGKWLILKTAFFLENCPKCSFLYPFTRSSKSDMILALARSFNSTLLIAPTATATVYLVPQTIHPAPVWRALASARATAGKEEHPLFRRVPPPHMRRQAAAPSKDRGLREFMGRLKMVGTGPAAC